MQKPTDCNPWAFFTTHLLTLQLHHFPFLDQPFNLLDLVANEQNVGHVDFLRRVAAMDDHVARTQADDPMSEQVVLPFGERHPRGVVDRFAGADGQANADLAGSHNYVSSVVKDENRDGPDYKKRSRNE